MLSDVKLIIWDWNGTLLNDVSVCVEAMNEMLSERKLALLNESVYRDVFTFPVKNYYQKLGFDFNSEPFEIPAMQFMDLYRVKILEAGLQEGAVALMKQMQRSGFRQVILSAMEQELLLELLDHFQIRNFFDFTYGIDNHFGGGKLERGLELMRQMHVSPSECLLIGDTEHDAEVASALGCRCLLFGGGHQSEPVLQATGNRIIHQYSDLLACF
ncbi:MAG: HAD family hydrolase [Bacteroidales bacterium]